jgi:WD40 repeat protein
MHIGDKRLTLVGWPVAEFLASVSTRFRLMTSTSSRSLDDDRQGRLWDISNGRDVAPESNREIGDGSGAARNQIRDNRPANCLNRDRYLRKSAARPYEFLQRLWAQLPHTYEIRKKYPVHWK